MRPLKALMVLGLFLVLVVDSSAATTLRVPLKKIAPVRDHQLRGTMDSYSFTVPVPARWSVLKATLHFTYVILGAHSPDLRLIFTRPRPDPRPGAAERHPEGEGDRPLALLKPGTTLPSGSQHYTDEQCEDPFAPELWTWLNLGEAYLVFELEPVPVPKRVSAIADFLFDPRNIFDTRVNLVIPELSPGYLKAASLAAAGIALRYKYRAPELVLSQNLRPGMDNIVIARRPAGTCGGAGGRRRAVIAVRLKRKSPGPGTDVLEPAPGLVVPAGTKPNSGWPRLCLLSSSGSRPPLRPLKLPADEHAQRAAGRSYTLASLGTRGPGTYPPAAEVDLRLPPISICRPTPSA
jgi:hypothetical protein